MTPARKASKSARPFSVSIVTLTIAINDTRYSVDAIDPGEFGTKAWRLSKHAGDHAVYDVLRQADGIIACDCPDYEARHRGNGYGTCKHGRALVELGLMPAPIAPIAPATLDPFARVEAEAPELPEIRPATSAPVEVPASTPGPCCDPVEAAPCVVCEAAGEVANGPTVPTPGDAPTHAQTVAELPPAVEVDPFPPDRLDAGDAEAPPELWPDWCDDDTWELGPDTADEPAEAPAPSLSLAELVEAQAVAYRAWPLAAGAMIARHLEDLAQRIRYVSATTPQEYEARSDQIDREARDQWEAIGFENGRASCVCRQCRGFEFGHSA
jgi:hypothetical protein